MNKQRYTQLLSARRAFMNENSTRSQCQQASALLATATWDELKAIQATRDAINASFTGWANATRANEFHQLSLDMWARLYHALVPIVATQSLVAWVYSNIQFLSIKRLAWSIPFHIKAWMHQSRTLIGSPFYNAVSELKQHAPKLTQFEAVKITEYLIAQGEIFTEKI